MTPLETIGSVAVAAVIGLAVGVPLGINHEAGKWQGAVAAEHQHELDAIAKANAAESDLAKVSTQINQTADEGEAARETRLATKPPDPLACPDAVDDAADLGELRKLIEPR
jgi:hypothetical protein